MSGEPSLKMRLVVNTDLKLPHGKMAAQVGHAVSEVTLWGYCNDHVMWNMYRASGAAKIVLKAPTETFERLAARGDAVAVRDQGRTCGLEPGTTTVLGFGPFIGADPELDALKLL